MDKENKEMEGNSIMPFITFQISLLLVVLIEMGEGILWGQTESV